MPTDEIDELNPIRPENRQRVVWEIWSARWAGNRDQIEARLAAIEELQSFHDLGLTKHLATDLANGGDAFGVNPAAEAMHMLLDTIVAEGHIWGNGRQVYAVCNSLSRTPVTRHLPETALALAQMDFYGDYWRKLFAVNEGLAYMPKVAEYIAEREDASPELLQTLAENPGVQRLPRTAAILSRRGVDAPTDFQGM